MAYISYIKLWENEFDKTVSNKDKVQEIKINQVKLEVKDTYKKDEKLTTNSEADEYVDVINKGYLDKKFLKINGHISLLEKSYNEVLLNYNKQSVEEIFIQRAVKTTIQFLYDKSLFYAFTNADIVLKDFLLQDLDLI